MKNKFVLILILSTVLFIGFIIINNKRNHQNELRRIVSHGRVIASSMWTLEKKSPIAYLSLAARSFGYRKIIVTMDNSLVFLDIKGPKLTTIDGFFYAAGLIQEYKLQTEVKYNENNIGWYFRVD